MKVLRFLITVFLCMALLVGCVQKRVIDDINIATGLSVDKDDNNKDQLIGSVMIPVFRGDKSVKNFTFTAKGSIMRDVISEMQKEASQLIVGGSLDIALVGEDVAREGMSPILDFLLRDPTIGARIQLAVVDGKAKDIFKGDYGDRGNNQYLRELLEHNMEGQNLPLTNLHLYLAHFYQEGKDAYLPYIKRIKPDLVSITGMALFKDDQLVDILPEDQLFYFKLLVDKHTAGSIMVKEKHGDTFVRSISSDNKMKLTRRNPYEFAIHITIKGYLTEHHGSILQKEELKEIEKQLEKQIIKECTTLIEGFQKQEIDPIGFGHFTKTKTRNFDFNKWKESYQSAQFKVTSDVNIIQIGVIK